jgi:hypothetical protein
MPYYPEVIVVWDDAHGDSEQWYDGTEVSHEPVVVKTLGYLMKEDSTGVTIWQEMIGKDGTSYRNRGFIPQKMIKEIIPLAKKRVKKVKAPL